MISRLMQFGITHPIDTLLPNVKLSDHSLIQLLEFYSQISIKHFYATNKNLIEKLQGENKT